MTETGPLAANGGHEGEATRARAPIGDLAFASAGIVAGVIVAISASSIRVPPGSTNTIGPRAFPYAVAVLLILASAAVIVSVLRGKRVAAEEGEDVDENASTDWVTVAVLGLLFIVFGLLIQPVGWPIAVLVLFGGTAWKLGAKQWWKALVIGLFIGLLTQYLFGTLLGISLPAGPIFDWIPIFDG